MKMHKNVFVPLAFAFVLVAATSCKKELIPGTYESQPAAMGNGTVKSWVTFDAEGIPQSMGLSLTDAALENLPDSTNHPSGNDHANIVELQLPPVEVTRTPFMHCAINWNPKGHIPVPIYDKPHFDVHFYMIGSAERKAIPDYESNPAAYDKYPPAGYLPPHYINPGKGEPEMGAHWIDTLSAELQPPFQFTQTFIYGSYDGMVTFYEPMVTYAFLKSLTADFTRSIPWPAKVQKSGHYPKQVRMRHADGIYSISLEQFEFRKAE